MQSLDNNTQVFLALVRAGLWETDVRLLQYDRAAYEDVMRLAENQSVVGLVTAGLEHVQDSKVSKEVLLQFIGQSLQIEQRNREMNSFISSTVENMRKAGIYGLLVKGSGLAQCYSRPLWRACGDVDFFFSDTEYKKAVEYFPLQEGATVVQNARYTKSFGVVIEPWFIELHGTLRNGLSTRMDKVIDSVQRDLFCGGNVRSCQNNGTTVFLPSPDNDVFLVFVHFVRHFYKEGVNLRQLCDWCRLLWTYRGKLDLGLLESRVKRAGLVREWKAFAALAVEHLNMPIDAIPMYDERFKNKGTSIIKLILNGSTGSKVRDTFAIFNVFPLNTILFLPGIFFHVNWLKIKERLFLQVKRQ